MVAVVDGRVRGVAPRNGTGHDVGGAGVGLKLCIRPGCPQWAFYDEDCCSYCQKVRDGLIVPDPLAFGRSWAQPRLARKVATINPADVVTDEQLELAQLLRMMGAQEHVVRRAMEKERRMPTSGSRHGTGVKVGRLVV